METNSEPDHGRWVDKQVSLLASGDDWEPNTAGAFVRLEQRRSSQRNGPRLIWAAAMCAACAAIPATRLMQAPGRSSVSAADKVVKDGQPAPGFTLPDESGTAVGLADLRGKVVVLNFWATWCGGCQVELPVIAELAARYRANGLSVVGMSMDDEGWKVVKPYLAAHPLPYPVVIGSEDLAAGYGLTAMPMTFVIGRDGKVAASHIGVVDRSVLEAEIVRQLQPGR